MANPDTRTGTTFVTGAVSDWLDLTHAPQDAALAQAANAPETQGLPPIHVNASEGKLLTLLMRMVAACRVVEVGTLAGYSAICIARGLAPGGHLWTVEIDERHAAVARDNIAAAGLQETVTVIGGRPASEVLQSLETGGPLDAVFVDADKDNYDAYGRWAADHIRPGGLLIGDNTALFGELLAEDDERAQAMRRFHEQAAEAFDTVHVPTPDGLLIGIRR